MWEAVDFTEWEGDFYRYCANRNIGMEEIEGVIVDDMLAPSTVEDIKQGADGSILIETLMADEIETQEEADLIGLNMRRQILEKQK